MKYYRRLCETLNDRGILIPSDRPISDYVKNTDLDYYLSTFRYTEEQQALFLDTGTIAGVTDVTTNSVWWDFDCEADIEDARISTLMLVDRLLENDIAKEDIAIAFSGNKGFGVEVNVTQTLTPKEVRAIAFTMASDLPHFDAKVYNASRVLRVRNTKHQKSKKYKIPIIYQILKEMSAYTIAELANYKAPPDDENFRWAPITLPPSIYKSEELAQLLDTPVDKVEPTSYLDYSMKPKFLTNCRWAIQNGFFKEGDRSHALLCLASSYRNIGFSLEHVYRMLKASAQLQKNRYNTERFSDEQMYNNIVMQVFGPHWKHGQYTCREKDNWLQTFCSALDHPCNHREDDEFKPKLFSAVKDSFKEYVYHVETNTIKTGIVSIDQNVFISTGASVGLIGSSGSGKTSAALNILNNTSLSGVKSVFASLDMHRNRMFEKAMYKIANVDRETLYNIFKENKEDALMKKFDEQFGNVYFFNKSCPSVEDIRNYIIACQEKSGEKIKLVMLDYFERISSDIGDDTAASKRVAGELQDLVNDLDVALVNLVQPHKAALSGGVESPIYDYTKIKGSSYLYQSMRIILSLWRPFYNPKTFENDKYMKMAVLKNDLGELSEFTFKWNGPRGEISEMDKFAYEEYNELVKLKQELLGDNTYRPWI